MYIESIVNATLGAIIVLILRQWLSETRDLKKTVSSLVRRVDEELAPKISALLSEVLTIDKNLGDRLDKLRRTVGSTNLVLRRRSHEINQINRDLDWASNKLEEHSTILKKAVDIGRSFNTRLREVEGASVTLKVEEDTYILKGKKAKIGSGE